MMNNHVQRAFQIIAIHTHIMEQQQWNTQDSFVGNKDYRLGDLSIREDKNFQH